MALEELKAAVTARKVRLLFANHFSGTFISRFHPSGQSGQSDTTEEQTRRQQWLAVRNVPTCKVSGVDFQLNLNSETVDHSYPSEPVCLPPTATVREAIQRMNDRNEAAVLVCQDGRLVGIFTERDALKRMASGAGWDMPLMEVMTQRPAALSIRDTVGKAIAKLSQGGYRRLPIVDDQGQPTGMLKIEGILHYLIEHFPAVIYNLPPEPHHAARDTDGA